jgi:hypothetical protein
MASFREQVLSAYGEEPSDSVARMVRDRIADRFGAQTAYSIFDYWCSDPPFQGCPGYEADEGDDQAAMDLFQALTATGYSADEAIDSAGTVFGDVIAAETAAFWCSPPAYAGCEDSAPGRIWADLAALVEEGGVPDAAWASAQGDGDSQLAGAILRHWRSLSVEVDGASAMFERLTAEGYSADEARDSASAAFGDVSADEWAAFWCSPPAYAGCEGTAVADVWSSFQAGLENGLSPEEARRAMASSDAGLVEAIYDEWCEREVCGGIGQSFAGDIGEAFEGLMESESSVDDARRAVATQFGIRAAAAEAVYWCSPPAYSGCDGSRVEQAWDAFRASLDSGGSLESARARVAEMDALLAEALYDWCSPTGAHCMSLAPRLAADCSAGGAELRADSVFASITCTWNRAGSFSVSASVRRLSNGELLDLSEELGGVVASDTKERRRVAGVARTQVKPPQSENVLEGLKDLVADLVGRDDEQGADLTSVLGETQTVLIALAMLVLPLGMGLVVMPLGNGLTPGSIKPRFYIQCLYLTPVVLAIWIPFVLVNYVPEPELGKLSVFLAGALIVLLLCWLLLTEVDFVAGERGVSKPTAVGISLGALAVSLVAARILLDHESAAASLGLTKFNIAGYVGVGLVILLFLPGLAGISHLLRRRREVEP